MKRHDHMILLTILNVLYTFDLKLYRILIYSEVLIKKSVLVNTYGASNL